MGHNTADDAGVYRLSDDIAVVQTVDLFPPVVDDAYDFGRIAAANALSDVYAMGATPVFALSVVGFPLGKLKLEVLGEILRGGQDVALSAGIDIIGGHTLDDTEPKYGLSVTGRVHPDEVWRNVGARPGDALLLTKPLGTGVLTTAIKGGKLDDETIALAVQTMATLNRAGAEALGGRAVHACTDVTGFGLLGHLGEMVSASHVRARLHVSQIPPAPARRGAGTAGCLPGRFATQPEARERVARRFTRGREEHGPSCSLTRRPPVGCSRPCRRKTPPRRSRRSAAATYPFEAAIIGEVTDAHEGGSIALED